MTCRWTIYLLWKYIFNAYNNDVNKGRAVTLRTIRRSGPLTNYSLPPNKNINKVIKNIQYKHGATVLTELFPVPAQLQPTPRWPQVTAGGRPLQNQILSNIFCCFRFSHGLPSLGSEDLTEDLLIITVKSFLSPIFIITNRIPINHLVGDSWDSLRCPNC